MKTKLEYKQLDGTIHSKDLEGDNVSLSHKCGDMDRNVPEMLGVSAALLDNVIFCHQEDSDWPMKEGIVLKKRFDDVFESTRYAKALEAFSKARKEMSAKVSELKIQRAELEGFKTSAEDAKGELRQCEEHEEECIHTLDEVKEKIEQLDERITRYREIMSRMQASMQNVQELEWKLQSTDRLIIEKKSRLEGEEMVESDDELRQKFENFENDMLNKQQELKALQRKVDASNNDILKMRDNTDDLNMKKGLAESLQSQCDEVKSQIIKMAKTASLNYSIPLLSATANSNEIRDFLKSLSNKMTSTQDEISKNTNDARMKLKSCESDAANARKELQRLEIEFDHKKSEFANIENEKNLKVKEVSGLPRNAENMLLLAQTDFDNAKKNHDEDTERYRQRGEQLKQELKQVNDDIRRISEEFSSDEECLREMNANRNDLAKLSALKSALEEDISSVKEESTTAYKNNKGELNQLEMVMEAPTKVDNISDILSKLNEKIQILKRQVHSEKEIVVKVKGQIAAVDAVIGEKKSFSSTITKKHDDLQHAITPTKSDCLKKLSHVCDILSEHEPDMVADIHLNEKSDINSILEVCTKLLDLFQNIKSFVEANVNSFDRLNAKLKKKSDVCPCCDQKLESDAKLKLDSFLNKFFKKELPFETDPLKAKVEDVKEKLSLLVTDSANLESMKAELDEIEDRLNGMNSHKSELMEREKSHSENVSNLEKQLSSFEKAFKNFEDLEGRWKALNSKQEEFDYQKRRCSQSMTQTRRTETSIEELEELQRQRTAEKEMLLTKKDKIVKDDSENERRKNSLVVEFLEKEKALAEAKEKGNRLLTLNAAIETMQKQLDDCRSAQSNLRKLVDDSKIYLREKEGMLTVAKEDLRTQEDKGREMLEGIKSIRDNFLNLVNSLDGYSRKVEETNLSDIVNTLDRIQSSIITKQQEIKGIQPKIAELNVSASNHERGKRKVQDNIDLRATRRERDDIKEKYEKAKAALGTSGDSSNRTVERDLQKAQSDRQRYLSERDKLLGNLDIYGQQSDSLRRKLNGENYRDIDKRYGRKNIELQTTEMAVIDLKSYYDALDQSLQNFHSLKIKEINKIIRELWQTIYKGTDIEMIELESGQDAAQTGKATRSYNYRVVMKKGDYPLDMRGRCSAGQRVLASIVIRLALAETFCLNCGILTLDEPTTNLDEANKAGLAEALSRLIISRAKQQNFQLICITHDEDFVRAMNRHLTSGSADFAMPENYFRIGRECPREGEAYFSVIERIPWDKM